MAAWGPVDFVAMDHATIGDAVGAVEVLDAARRGSG